jgi:magnesium chelatase subunit D
MAPDAAAAARLFAADPAGTGIRLRCPAGPERDAFLALLRSLLPAGAPWRRVPLQIADDRLLGGVDLAATLAAGRPVESRGLLTEAEGGVVVLAMAERLPGATAAKITAAMDAGARFGVIALDEGGEDEQPPAGLLDRLAFVVTLVMPGLEPGIHGVQPPPASDGVTPSAPGSSPGMTCIEILCAVAAQLGIASIRAPLLALRAARAAAALAGRAEPAEADLTLAVRLVLAPRATRLPEPAEQEAEPEPDENPDPGESTKPLEDRVVEAARAAIPAGLLAQLAAGTMRTRTPGKAGALGRSGRRGRPAGVRTGDPRRGDRLNLIETLRAAAPWQGLRRKPGGACIAVRPSDFRVTRVKPRSETTTIFVVDASGSAALARLGEAKGAVELLLAECYVRRDRVAVLAFRGKTVEVLLPPTRSLVRAKRSLAGLPGGGGTPLASALDAGAAMAGDVRRRGGTPTLVLLTDGRANVARDGTGGRARAEADAVAAAKLLRAGAFRTLLVDTSPRPHAPTERLAAQMGARYVPLPYADSAAISRTVMEANR